ncbi:MAG: hypothetical protein AB1801_07575 [Chloroflexota bacterium]
MVLLRKPNDSGQGLVEYALILVLVAIVAIGILRILGPAVGTVFSRVTNVLGYSVITGVSAERTGNGHGNDVVVTINVSSATAITVTDSQSGQTQTVPSCSSSCSVTLSGVGPAAGTATISAEAGSYASVNYAAQL